MKKKIEETKVIISKKDIESILGECHDGEDYKVQMKDGTIKIISKEEVDNAK